MQKGGLWEKGIYKEDIPDRPLVTVVTVTFNADHFLDQALQSIFNQTYTNVELIVIDGGSTDSTLAIIRKHESKIDFWQSEPDKGIYDAMNKGLKLARGSWIGFKNADDWFLPNAIETVVMESKRVQADVFYGNTLSVLQESPLTCAPFLTDHKTIGQNPGIDHRSTFVRTLMHRQVPFDLQYRLGADLDVFWRLVKKKARFQHINAFLSYKRYGGASDGTRIMKETFMINARHQGYLFATYLRLKIWLRYYMWRASNFILRWLLGTERYHQFKSRKISS